MESFISVIVYEIAGCISQRAKAPNPVTYVGSGKLEEIRESIEIFGAGKALSRLGGGIGTRGPGMPMS